MGRRESKIKRQLIEDANRRILKESENTSWDILNEQGAETQDITGPIALAGGLHDCYVYRYNPESKNIQKYKSTGEKDYLYKYAEGDKWGNSSDRQNAKFKKALELLDSGYKGGVFKVKPWEGVENAVGGISAAMTAIKKEYCSTGAKGDKVVKDDKTTIDWPEEFSCVTGEGFEAKTNEDGTITYVSDKGNTYFSDGKAKSRSGADWAYKCQDGKVVRAAKGAGEEKEDDIGSKGGGLVYWPEDLKKCASVDGTYDEEKDAYVGSSAGSTWELHKDSTWLHGGRVYGKDTRWYCDGKERKYETPEENEERLAAKEDKESFMSDKFLGPDAEFIYSQIRSANVNKNEMKQIHDVIKKYEKDGSICDLVKKYSEVATKGGWGKQGLASHIAGIAFWRGNEHREGSVEIIRKANCK